MKRIIACTDFSTNARNAVNYAFELAQYYKSELWIVHTYLTPVLVSEFPLPPEAFTEAQKNAEENLLQLKNELMNKSINPITIHIHLHNESLILCLKELCKETEPDLIVIGTRGTQNIVDVLVGSNTIKVVNELNWPVLVVPEKATFTPIHKIGFACDFKKVVETTPDDLIKKLVEDFNAEFHVINVDYMEQHVSLDMPEQSLMLDQMLFNLMPKYHFIESEDLAAGVDTFVSKNKIDLIIAIRRKHSIMEKIFRPSHVKQFIYHTSVPILCLHQH